MARAIRCDLLRIFARNFRNLFAAAKFCDRNRARSRQNPVPHVLQRLTTRPRFVNWPHHQAVREIRCDFQRISDRNFRNYFPKPQHFGFEIAPKSAVPRVLQPGHDPQRSPDTVPSVGMLWRVRFGAIRGEFLTEIFETFSRPRNFAIETARDRAEIRCASRAAAWPRPAEVPRHCVERRHAVAALNFRKFRSEIRSKSHAPQHADARNRCCGPLGVVRKLRNTRRQGFRRDLARFRTKNFAAAKIFENFGPKSAPNRTKSYALQLADPRNRC